MKFSDLNLFALTCAVLVAIFWGLYGPAVALSRSPNREWGPFKPYVFIGIAYMLIAVVGGAIMMKMVSNDNFDFTGKYLPSMKWGFYAGCLGALGALALTFAIVGGGKPSYVMPIVFGGAVSVNAIVAYFGLHSGETVNPMMWFGMLLVAIGICLTAYNTPHGHAPAKPTAGQAIDHASVTVGQSDTNADGS